MDNWQLSGEQLQPLQPPPPNIVELVHQANYRDQAEQFLRRWFGPSAVDVEPEADGIATPYATVTCFHRDTGSGRSFTRPAAEADQLIGDVDRAGYLDGNWNVYVRCTTMSRLPGPTERGGASDTCQLPGLWVDLDEKDGVGPLDVARFEAALPLPVTAVTYSGGGWHLWVHFTQPVYGIPAAGKMARRWRYTVERCASQVGIKADSICSGDLARVMRLAGTPNVKPDRPRPMLCEFLTANWHQAISPEDADDALDDVVERPAWTAPLQPASSDLPGAQFSAAVPSLAVLQSMGGHDAWTDDEGLTYVMRPGKDRGGHAAVVYPDGHVAVYSSSWVGPGTRFPHVLNANSGEPGCVYNDSFRLLAHAFYGPEDAGYHEARTHVQSLGYGAGWQPGSDAEFDRLVSMLGPKSSAVELPPPPQPAAQLAPVQQPPMPMLPAPWAAGYLDPGEMLEAWGFNRRDAGSGNAASYGLLAADPMGRSVAWVYGDGGVTFEASATKVMPVISGTRYGWSDLLALALDTDGVLGFDDVEAARNLWARMVDPAQAFEGDDLICRLRRCVTGVEGVGHAVQVPRFPIATAAEISRRPKPPPLFMGRNDDARLVYDRKLNIVYGQAESGKTWLCAHMARHAVEVVGTNVLWLDLEEPGRAQVADRLSEMGALAATSEHVWCLDAPLPDIINVDYGKRTIDLGAMVELQAIIRNNGIGLVVIDSYGELAGSQDLDDNRKPDLAFLKTHVLTPLLQQTCIVLIDHTGHSTGAREAGSKFKRNTVDGTSLYVETVSPFRPGFSGSARIWAMKDRHANVYRRSHRMEGVQLPGDTKPMTRYCAGTMRMGPSPYGHQFVNLTLEAEAAAPAPVQPGAGGTTRGQAQDERLWAALASFPDATAPSETELVRVAKEDFGYELGYKGTQEILKIGLHAGTIVKQTGAHNSFKYKLTELGKERTR